MVNLSNRNTSPAGPRGRGWRAWIPGAAALGTGRPYGEGPTCQPLAHADRGRILQLVGLASVIALGIAALMILPAWVGYLGIPTHRYSVELSALGVLGVYGVARLVASRPGAGPAPS